MLRSCLCVLFEVLKARKGWFVCVDTVQKVLYCSTYFLLRVMPKVVFYTLLSTYKPLPVLEGNLCTQARVYREIHALEIVFCEREYPGRHSPLVQKSFIINPQQEVTAAWFFHYILVLSLPFHAGSVQRVGSVVYAIYKMHKINHLTIDFHFILFFSHDLEIRGGCGNLASKSWRVGLMGYNATLDNARFVVKCIEEARRECKMAADNQ